jgi:hypothetical protein
VCETIAKLPNWLRETLRKPVGPVFKGEVRPIVEKYKPVMLVSVGDIITYNILKEGIVPDICFVDARSQRKKVSDEILDGTNHPLFERVEVCNPPATITRELILTIISTLRERKKTRIFINGEEDLAVLPVSLLVPEGSLVLYGQPEEGYVALFVSEPLKMRMKEIMEMME